MAYSFEFYSGDGANDQFSIPFPYLNQQHVKVFVGGVAAPFTFLNDSVVKLTTPPPNGVDNVKVQRTTPVDAPLVDFEDTSTLTEENLDLSNLQNLYVAQEAVDKVTSALLVDNANAFDTGNRKIVNGVAGTDSADFVIKSQLDSVTGAVAADAQAAATSASNASTSETNAGISETNAGSSAVSALNYANAAQGSATAADLSAQAAAASAASLQLPLNKLDAATNPTANDDGADTSGNGEFTINSTWVNTSTDEAFKCVDNSTGAAVWVHTTLTIDELGAIAFVEEVSNSDLANMPGDSLKGRKDWTTGEAQDITEAMLSTENSPNSSDFFVGFSAGSLKKFPHSKIVPVGSIMAWPGNTPPTGWLELNGAEINRVSYSALWSFANTSGNIVADGSWTAGQFSTGNLATTFRIPDLRGEFIRGFDNGRGIDSGRSLGSWQEDMLLNIKLATWHPSTAGSDVVRVPFANTSTVHNYQALTTLNNSQDAGRIGTETRPRNVAYKFCIKY